jgi:hypothetical protein
MKGRQQTRGVAIAANKDGERDARGNPTKDPVIHS